MKKFFITVLSLLLFTVSVSAAFANTGDGVTLTKYAPYNTYVSPIKKAPISFTGLGVSWHQNIPSQTSAEISVRFQHDQNWSQWYTLETDIDGKTEANESYPSSFLPVARTDVFQYKIILRSEDPAKTPVVENIEFTYIDSSEGKKISEPKESLVASIGGLQSLQSKSTNTIASIDSSLKIISRAEWGADESLRLYKDNNPAPVLVATESDFSTKYANELKIVKKIEYNEKGERLTWPLEYPEKISKIIIHHTATTKNLDNPKQAIRDIYYWHTITRGWGDIGYNYIIDQKGNIYEGRAGGDANGAHTGRFNIGSIGIAVLGNYQDEGISEETKTALVKLIRAKSKQYNIDPAGVSTFRGENIPNVIGHRDAMSTSCPGEKLYAMLPTIRQLSKGELKPVIIDRGKNLEVNKKYKFDVAGEIPYFQMESGNKKELKITLKNSGPTTWSKGTQLVLNRDADAVNYFITDTITKSIPLNKEVKPQETVTFSIELSAGPNSGYANIELFPMIGGTIKVERYLRLPVQIKNSKHDFEIVEVKVDKPYLRRGMLTEAVITLKNTGETIWRKDGNGKLMLGSESPRDHINTLLRNPGARLASLEEQEVHPGQLGHFKVLIKAPQTPGKYREYFTPVLEGVKWFENKNSYFEIYVYDQGYKGDAEKYFHHEKVKPGETKKVSFELKNIGGVPWKKNGSAKFALNLKNENELIVKNIQMLQDQVEPGETATITMDVQVPNREGTYYLRLEPRFGAYLVLKRLMNFTFDVHKKNTSSGQSSPTKNPPSSQNPSNIPVNSNQSIRIDLSFQGNPVITGNGSFVLQKEGKEFITFAKEEKVSVLYEQNQYKIQSGNKSYVITEPPRFIPKDGTILRVDNFERRPSWNQNVNYNEFKGTLEVRWYKDRLHTINELPLEDYLKGTGEINEKEPYEKLKTIIVVSRSYAYFYMTRAEKFPGAPFHLTDDPQTSQKYVGYSAEKSAPNTVKAVNETAGIVVTYKGKVIKTPYFSSDDGRTRSAEEVWGWKDTPYLISVPDPYCEGKTLNGHGVGLSGCGSLGMAKAGKTFQEIIQYYYQGVELTKI